MIRLALGVVVIILLYSLFHNGVSVEVNGKKYSAKINTEREK